MASGPFHFREAERLLKRANEVDFDLFPAYVAEAQVHATLALVAATVGNQEQDMDLVDEAVRVWDEVLVP